MKQKFFFVIYLLFGLMFINAGLNKFFNYMPAPDDLPQEMVEMATAMANIGWLFPLVAVVEIIAGILVIIPRFRALGAVVIFPIMIGIMLTHITAAPSGLPMASIFLIVNLWMIFENREKYLPLIKE